MDARSHNHWYYFALLYFAGMAITGVAIRYSMPENSLNQERYMGYMFILTVFWPVTLISMVNMSGEL